MRGQNQRVRWPSPKHVFEPIFFSYFQQNHALLLRFLPPDLAKTGRAGVRPTVRARTPVQHGQRRRLRRQPPSALAACLPTRSRRSFSPRSTSCRCTRLRRAAARCGQTQTARSRAPAPPDNEKWSASSRWRMAWHRWCASSPTWGSSAKSTPTRAPQPLGPWFKWSARSQRPHLDPGRGGVCHQGLDILLPRLPHGAVGRRAARSQRDRHPE